MLPGASKRVPEGGPQTQLREIVKGEGGREKGRDKATMPCAEEREGGGELARGLHVSVDMHGCCPVKDQICLALEDVEESSALELEEIV